MENIHICVRDIELSRLRKSKRVTVWGIVYLQVNKDAFPDNMWSDCLDMIVPSWLQEIESFLVKNREDCTLFFYDGPFSMQIRRVNHSTIHISCVESGLESDTTLMDFQMELSAFLSELTAFCETVLDHCSRYSSEYHIQHILNSDYKCLARVREYSKHLLQLYRSRHL